MAARADFACKHCSEKIGHEVVHRDLAVNTKTCPLCRRKRGFARLFNGVNVSAARHRDRVAKFIDTRLQPAFDHQSEQRAGAKRFVEAATEAFDRAWEKTPAAAATGATGTAKADAVNQEREVLRTMSPRHGGKPAQVMPAAAALSMIPGDARAVSAERNYAALSGQLGRTGGFSETGLWMPPPSNKMPRPNWVRRGG